VSACLRAHKPYAAPTLAPHSPRQVTHHELALTREQEEAARADELRQRALAARREVDEASYGKLVDAENANRRAFQGLYTV
jgi:hypothetical protein